MHLCKSFFTCARLGQWGSAAVGQWERKGCEDETVGRWQAGSMGGWEEESMRGWEDERTGSKREEGNGKDGERNQTKPYTTIPSRGFAPGKLPLDRPHQGAVMLIWNFRNFLLTQVRHLLRNVRRIQCLSTAWLMGWFKNMS